MLIPGAFASPPSRSPHTHYCVKAHVLASQLNGSFAEGPKHRRQPPRTYALPRIRPSIAGVEVVFIPHIDARSFEMSGYRTFYASEILILLLRSATLRRFHLRRGFAYVKVRNYYSAAATR